MATKQIPLKGISRMPDDSISDTGSLMHSVNLCNDGAGLHLIEKPQVLFTLGDGEECVFIHETPSYKHYIILKDGRLFWYDGDYTRHEATICSVDNLTAIDSIGNTIVYNDNGGVKYLLYNEESGYKNLGGFPDMVKIQFGLTSEFGVYPENGLKYFDSDDIYGGGDGEQVFKFMNTDQFESNGNLKTYHQMVADGNIWGGFDVDLKDKEYIVNNNDVVMSIVSGWTEFALAAVNKLIGNAVDKNKFVFPFFIRYAYDLYDGSQIVHSYPVFMIPNSKGPVFAVNRGYFKMFGKRLATREFSYDMHIGGNAFAYLSTLELCIKSIPDNLEDWKDVVKGVGIYCTAPIYTYDQNEKVYGWMNMEEPSFYRWDDYYTVSRHKGWYQYGKNSMKKGFETFYRNFNPMESSTPAVDDYPTWVMNIPQKSIEQIHKEISNAGEFFKLADIDIDELIKIKAGTSREYTIGVTKELKMDDNALRVLATNRQMDDDNYTHDKSHSDVIYTYNKRVNLGGVKRYLHNPIDPTIQFPIKNNEPASHSCKIAIYIHNGEKTDIVVSDYGSTQTKDAIPEWIYYPNNNAFKAVLMYNSQFFEMQMREHPLLNGSYWCNSLWNINESEEDGYKILPDDFVFPQPTSGYVDDRGKVYTSNVENPLFFPIENRNQVGDGAVRALCANTQSVNSFNFGYATMYAFTEKGVWGMKVTETGGFKPVQPITRDVITEGTKPLPLGQSIVFLANSGVLRIDINSSLTKPMGYILQGLNDSNIDIASVVNATMGVNAVAIMGVINGIGNPYEQDRFFWHDSDTKMMYDSMHDRVYFSNGSGSFVWNRKTDTWCESTNGITKELNSWPTCEYQDGNRIVTLDTNEKHGFGVFVTRPINTGGEWYSRVEQTIVRGLFNPFGGDVKVALFASRNWNKYMLVGSSKNARLTRHYGSGYHSHVLIGLVDTERPKHLTTDYVVMDVVGDEQNKLR